MTKEVQASVKGDATHEGEHTAPNGQVFSVEFRGEARAAVMTQKTGHTFKQGWYYKFYDASKNTLHTQGTFTSSTVAHRHAVDKLKASQSAA